MKTNHSSLSSANWFTPLLAAIVVCLGAMTLSACQQEPEVTSDTSAASDQSITTGDKDQQNNKPAATDTVISDSEIQTEREIDLEGLENNIGAAGVTPNAVAATPNIEENISGTQITDVIYKSATGATMSVVFETSAQGTLNAIVTLPNQPKMTLSAPEGQGNNPTYRSSDGSIELISHGGGSSIDVKQNNKVTSFQAISAEAEVVTQP